MKNSVIAAILVLAQPLGYDAVHDLIWYEHGGIHVLLGFQTQLRAGGNLCTKQSTGAQRLETVSLGKEVRLRTLTGGRGTYKYKSLERFHISVRLNCAALCSSCWAHYA